MQGNAGMQWAASDRSKLQLACIALNRMQKSSLPFPSRIEVARELMSSALLRD